MIHSRYFSLVQFSEHGEWETYELFRSEQYKISVWSALACVLIRIDSVNIKTSASSAI